MADQSDVEAALVGLIGGALYPNGLSAACAVTGAVCRVYRGWPVPAALDTDLAAGVTNVSVTVAEGHGRNTTRWPDRWLPQKQVPPTLTATVSGETMTVAGTAAAGQIVAVIADTAWAAWRTQDSDTPASIVAALATSLSNVRAASASGATLAVPGALKLVGRVEADQPTLRLTRRQEQVFRATAWCADPTTRDAVGSAIDAALSGIDFIGLADGTSGRLLYLDSKVSDRWEDATLYQRELTYSVDYPTTIVLDLPRMAIGGMQYTVGTAGITETLLS